MNGGVLQLISSLGVGGAERLLVDYIVETAHDPRQQVVVVMNRGESPDFRREIEAAGRPVHFLQRRRSAPTPWTLAPILRLVREHRIAVVHSHNEGSKAWSCLAKAAKPSLKLVHTVHNTGVVTRYGSLQRSLHAAAIDGCIAVSPAVAAECVAAGLRNVAMIENGVALHRFTAGTPRTRAGALRILCVGRLTPQKGQDLLLEALMLAKSRGLDWMCRLIGEAGVHDAGYAAGLRHLIASHDLADRVSLEGGRTGIADILPWADLFVMPSRFEGFGLALIEAMAAGLPTIAADVDGPGRILRDHPGAGVLVPPASTEALADAILRLAADEDARRRLARAAPLAAADYSVTRMARRYEAFYAGL